MVTKTFVERAKRVLKGIAALFVMIPAKWKIHKLGKDRNILYIVCPHGIGDTLFVASLVKALKVHYRLNKVYLIVKENHASLPDLFDDIDGKIVSSRDVKTLSTYFTYLGLSRKGNVQYGHFISHFSIAEPGQMLGVKGLCLLDVYKRCVMHVPDDAPIQSPCVFAPLDTIRSYKEKYGDEKKTVVLLPYAVTLDKLPLKLWETLVRAYLKLGYRVYTNISTENEEPISGSEKLFVPLDELFIISRMFRWKCVALRSGVCDLLGFSDIDMLVLHENKILEQAWNMEGSGLPNPHMKDVVIPPDIDNDGTMNALIEDIVAWST